MRVGATLGLGACIYFSARMGAPGFAALGHLFGLVFAALGLATNWMAWFVVLEGYNFAVIGDTLRLAPAGLLAKISALSESQAVAVGGTVIKEASLRGFWIAQVVFVAIAGLMGGQSAYEIRRERRRAALARSPS